MYSNSMPHKMNQLVNEVEEFMEILSKIPEKGGLDADEKAIILAELKMSLKPMKPFLNNSTNDHSYTDANASMSVSSSTSMVLMIFRFYIQSGEYDFFIKRLKNVAVTKLSLKTVG